MSDNSIKISVIVPVYNVEEFLHQAIDSIINQTMKDIEIICVEDCSDDNCKNILREYAKKDKRIVLIENEVNKGQGYSRNIALDIARGEYIMYLDPDDWYEPDAFEIAYNHITKYNNDIVFFNKYIYSEKLNLRFVDDIFGEKLDLIKDNKNANISNTKIPLNGFCFTKIYRKYFLIENNCKFTDTRCGEDFIFAVTTTYHAKSISFLNKPLCTYRTFVKDNKYKKNVAQKRIAKYEDSFYNREVVFDFMLNHNLGLFKDEVLKYWINSLADCCLYYSGNNKKHAQEIYERSRDMLKIILGKYSKESLPDEVAKKKIDRILKYRYWWQYSMLHILPEKIFYVKNKRRPKKSHKVVNIMGIKMKFSIKNKILNSN